MARQKKTTDEAGANVVSFKMSSLTEALQHQVSDIKRPVLAAASQWGVFREKVADLAPRVMKVFRAIQYHFDNVPGAKKFKFIDFVRLIDPATPATAEEYRNYRTFYTLRYMQTVENAANRESTAGQPQGGPIRDKAVILAARLIKTLENIPGINAEQIISEAVSEVGLSKNVQTRLEKRIEALEPLFRVTVTGRGAAVKLDLVRMTPEQVAAAEGKTAPAMAQPGQTVHVQALAARLGESIAKGKHAARRKSA